MIDLIGAIVTPAATGGAGAAAATVTSPSPVEGLLIGLYVEYTGSPPNTTDLTLATLGSNGSPPSNTFLTLTNNNSGGWFYPRGLIHGTDGVEKAADYTLIPLFDHVTVTLAQTDNNVTASVWLLVEY